MHRLGQRLVLVADPFHEGSADGRQRWAVIEVELVKVKAGAAGSGSGVGPDPAQNEAGYGYGHRAARGGDVHGAASMPVAHVRGAGGRDVAVTGEAALYATEARRDADLSGWLAEYVR